MSQDALRTIMFVLGGVMALASIWVLWRARRDASAALNDDAACHAPPGPRPWTLRGVGAISTTTRTVIGLAGIGLAYHLVVHAAGWSQFRAPLPVALGVALVAVLASLGVDALEHRMLRTRGPRDDEPPG